MNLDVLYRAAVETMKREIISQRAKIAALEAEVASLRINQQPRAVKVEDPHISETETSA